MLCVDKWIPSGPPGGQDEKLSNDPIACVVYLVSLVERNQRNQKDQMNQLLAMRREMLLGTVSIPYDNARRSSAQMVAG